MYDIDLYWTMKLFFVHKLMLHAVRKCITKSFAMLHKRNIYKDFKGQHVDYEGNNAVTKKNCC